MSKSFPTGTVLLISVGEGRVGPLLHIMQGAIVGRNALDKGTAEGSVSKVERLAAAMVSSRREGVLAWAAEEKKAKVDRWRMAWAWAWSWSWARHMTRARRMVMLMGHTLEGVGSSSAQEGLKSEGVMDTIQVGIREAQPGELLAHST